MLRAPRKILAIKLRSLGDTVLMTAPLMELRTAFPEAEIHVMLTSAWTPLLVNHPGMDRVWTFDRHIEPAARAKALARMALKLRKEKYDCVVNFHASPSSATLAFATGAKTRSIHFHGHKDRNRYSTVEVPGKGILKPIIERDMDAVRALGLHVPAGRTPRIFLQLPEMQEGAERLRKLNLGSPVLALGLGASRPAKSWPLERFAEVAVAWCQKTGGGAIALMGSSEQNLHHEFLKKVDDVLQLSLPEPSERAAVRARIASEPGLPLRQMAAVISQCSVFLGNDSGPKHVAVAVGTPTVTLFGPEDPFEWHPYPPELHPYLFVEGLACRRDADPGMPPWCGLNACSVEQHRCMTELGIERVLQQCLSQCGKR